MKSRCVFVFDNKLGGIGYLNINIINNSVLAKQFFVKVVLICDSSLNKEAPLTEPIKCDELVYFKCNQEENKYFTLKRLAEEIGEEEGALVCNDYMELEAMHLFPSKKTVYQIIHDFYSVKLFLRFASVIDVCVAPTQFFRDIIFSADINTTSLYLPHGVSIPDWNNKTKAKEVLKIVFTGRLVESKGVLELYYIDQILKSKSVRVEWTIIGDGELKQTLLEQWKNEKNVSFTTPKSNEDVVACLLQNDLFILPTTYEGLCIVVVEALSCGLVPIVTDLPAGIKENVTDQIGFRLPIGDRQAYADTIIKLMNDRELLWQMQCNGRRLAEEKFNITETSNGYFREFGNFRTRKKNKPIGKLKFGSTLDKPYIPDYLVSAIRKGKKLLK